MNRMDILLDKRNQAPKTTYCMSPFTYFWGGEQNYRGRTQFGGDLELGSGSRD